MRPAMRVEPQVGVAVAAVAALGVGTTLALAGAGADAVAVAATGGALAGAALVLLLASRMIDGAAVVVLALPLPAIYATGDVRIAAAAPVSAAVVLAGLISVGLGRRAVCTGALPLKSMAALLGWLFVAGIFAADRGTALREILNMGVLLVLLVALTDLVGDEAARHDRLIRLLALVAALCGALALLEMVGVIPGRFPRWGTSFHRAALGFGQPNGLGLFLAATLPLAVHAWHGETSASRRRTGAVAAAFIAVGLLATFSRGAWLAVLGGGLLSFALLGEWRRGARFLAAALLAALLLDVLSGGAIRDTIARSFGDWVVEQRFALMAAGLVMFWAHPFTGVGPGGYGGALDRYGAGIPELWDLQATPHNAFVQMAAETGAAGLLIFGAFLFAIGRTLWRRARQAALDPRCEEVDRSRRRALLWSFLVVCVASLFVWPFSHGSGQAFLVVLALGLSET